MKYEHYLSYQLAPVMQCISEISYYYNIC